MLRWFADITATLNPKTKPFESDMQQVGQCSASPESADISPSFDILHKKCATGRVRIVFLLGLARGGTTAIEKFLYERLPFDAQINEPSLLGPPEGSLSSAKSRVELTFKSVLAHVQRLEAAAAIAGQTEVTILIKEVTNKVLPEMIGLWARLSRWWLIVVRNPMLQVESRLKSMLDRIDSGALEEHGLRVDAHAAIMRVHGQLLFAAPEELRPVDTWRVAYNEMKRKRDLSNLGVGAMRAFTLHPFCMWPESQRAMLGGESISNDFSKLSEAQVAKIVDWRLGWTALATQLVALELSPVCPEALVVDFSSVQMDGGAGLIEWLEANVFIGHPSSGGALKEKFEACANSQLWSEADWAKWYASPCFEKALRSRAIEPVSKRPLGLDKLPAFLRPAIRAACNQWADLVSRDLRALPPPRPALRAPFIGLDPLHDAVCAAATGPGVALRRLLRRPARWRRRQRDIDLALSRLEDDDTAHRTKGHRALELVAACLVAFAQACMLLQCSMAYFWEHRIRIIATPWLLLKRGEYPIATDALLSVIVPAHNEATTVSACVRALLDRAKHKKNIEIIVVDAGSTDGTRQVVEQDFLPNNKHMLKIVDYVDGGGRGPALNAGVAESRGTLLLFIHADTIVPDEYDEAARLELEDPGVEIAAFGFETTHSRNSLVAKVLETCVNWRSRVLMLPWGDQGLAITRRRFDALDGGFKPIPVFEDIDLVIRARKLGAYRGRRIVTLEAKVQTSARRYADLYNFVMSNLLNAFLVTWWHLGATPSQLFRLYYGTRIAAVEPSLRA